MTIDIQEAEQHTILKIVAGSHVHGLNVPTSDRDEEAIIIEPMQAMLGLHGTFEELIRESDDLDVKYVSLKKWCSLALKGNPNFLLMLFAPDSMILKIDERGRQLRDMKQAFLSQDAIRSHLGYIKGQMQRVVRSTKDPEHIDFKSNEGRGQPRQSLVNKFGYDTKYAMHLLRLTWQGIQLARDGNIMLPMEPHQRSQLIDVRLGKYALGQIIEMAETYEAHLKYEFSVTKLPLHPDRDAVERWMLDAYRKAWNG